MPALEVELLEANLAFYSAFSDRDVEKMSALWAKDHAVACVHPGWNALSGREEVVASWRAILESDRSPRVTCSLARVHLLGETGFVLCLENVEGVTLVATNIFAREGDAWKLVHHHASPMAATLLEDDDTPPRVLN